MLRELLSRKGLRKQISNVRKFADSYPDQRFIKHF